MHSNYKSQELCKAFTGHTGKKKLTFKQTFLLHMNLQTYQLQSNVTQGVSFDPLKSICCTVRSYTFFFLSLIPTICRLKGRISLNISDWIKMVQDVSLFNPAYPTSKAPSLNPEATAWLWDLTYCHPLDSAGLPRTPDHNPPAGKNKKTTWLKSPSSLT